MPGADAPYRAGVEDAEVRVSPMVGMTAALVCGILAAPLLPELAVWTPFVAGGWLTIWAFLLRRRPALSFLCLLMVFATFGATRAKHCGTPAPDDVSRLAGYPSQYLVGTVAAEPEPTGDNGVRYPLHVFAGGDGRPLSGSIAVSQSANAGAVPRYGDWLVARGRPCEATW